MVRKILLVLLATFILSACGGAAAEEPFDPNTCVSIDGVQMNDGGWIPERITFCEEANLAPVEINQTLGEVTYTGSSSSEYALNAYTENLEDGYMIPLEYEVDHIVYGAGTLYNVGGVIYWYSIESTPFWETEGYTKVGEAYIDVEGTQQSDGGWIVTKVIFKSPEDKTIAEIRVSQENNSFEVWDDLELTGTLTYVEIATMEEGDFAELEFESESIPFPGGRLFLHNNTIFWYPMEIIPEWFIEVFSYTPKVNIVG